MQHVLGIAGRSGSGKTTLIEAMLPLLQGWGVRTSVVKHSHHDFPIEPAGKDSARFRQAGAHEVMIASPYRIALVHELRGEAEPSLAEQLARLAPVDLVLVEGFKNADIPRIEVHRPALGLPALYPHDPGFIAVASDTMLPTALPVLPLSDPARIALFVCASLGLLRHDRQAAATTLESLSPA